MLASSIRGRLIGLIKDEHVIKSQVFGNVEVERKILAIQALNMVNDRRTCRSNPING